MPADPCDNHDGAFDRPRATDDLERRARELNADLRAYESELGSLAVKVILDALRAAHSAGRRAGLEEAEAIAKAVREECHATDERHITPPGVVMSAQARGARIVAERIAALKDTRDASP